MTSRRPNSGGRPAPAAANRIAAAGADAPSETNRHHAPGAEEVEDQAVPSTGDGQKPCAEGQEPGPDHHERQVQLDLEELEAKAQRADEYLELAQRTKADFENYRKRAAREAAAAQERGVAKLARELLPAIDNLDRALAAAQKNEPEAAEEDGTIAAGIELVHAEVLAALARVGIEPFSPEGQRFDPQRHEAVAQQPVEGAEPGTVAEVYQRGYTLGDSILRPARVLVAA